MDATDEFNSIHSSKAKAMLAQYYIGDLVTEEQKKSTVVAASTTAVVATPPGSALTNGVSEPANGVVKAVKVDTVTANGVTKQVVAVTELVALDPRKKIPFKLQEKFELSHNVRLFRFALQSPQHKVRVAVNVLHERTTVA